jgi:membrane-bound metal-dependent hydrolase YbcI (DUF457 family)
MFVGHASLAFAAKSRLPRTPLAVLLAATFGLDILWPVLVLLGIERVRIDPGNTAFTPLAFDAYPWSHSLVMALVWGGLAALAWLAIRRDATAAWVIGALVVSHWVLDFASHRADMPLWPGEGSPRLGLGLWNSIPATLALEGAMFAAGIFLYVRATRARDRVGSWALWPLLLLLAAAWASGPFAPPPPGVGAVAFAGLALAAIMIPWSAWIDAHRPPCTAPRT